MAKHYSFKKTGYLFLIGLFVLLGLGLFFIVRALTGNASQSVAEPTPTPRVVGASVQNPATPTLPPIGTPIPTNTPYVPEAETPVPATPVPTPAPTPTPKSSIRTPTSAEKKNARAGYLTGNDINLRVGPSTSYKSLGKYKKNDTLVIYATDGDFSFVKMDKDNKIGFISKKYVAVSKTASGTQAPSGTITGKVSARTVALRSKPDKSSSAITELKAGDTVYIYHKDGSFYYLETTSGKKGYAWAEYISAKGTVPKKGS